MFTGIVEKTASVRTVAKSGNNLRISIDRPKEWKLKRGDSVAVAGVCLTVSEITKEAFWFDIVPETQKKTTFFMGSLVYKTVNIEQPMVFGDRMHGHMVTGHVDCTGKVSKVISDDNGYHIEISYPKEYDNLVASRGSITVDGVSLTIAEKNDVSFTVALVPHTLKITTLGSLKEGDLINLEFDILGKYKYDTGK